MKKIHSLFLLIILIMFSCKTDKEVTYSDQQYKKAENLYDAEKYNEAFTQFYLAYQGYAAEKRNTDAAYALIFLGIIQTEKGDFLGSNENLSKAAKLSGNDKILLTSIYNQFAINHNYLKNNKEALYWYKKALQLTENTFSQLSIKNNMGITEIKRGKYAEAQLIFKALADQPTIRDSIDFKNRVLDNFAYSKFLSGDRSTSGKEMLAILKSREARNDLFGMTASLSHLADFYSADNQELSGNFAAAMYENARRTGNADDQIDALRKMIDVQGESNVKPLFDKYRILTDSIENSKNNSKNLFTSVIYESEKNKADILVSQNQILKQRISILTLIAVVGLGLIGFFRWRKQQAHQKEIAVKDMQIKYSKKVHDVVANGLYHAMVEIQNNPNLDQQKILNRIEKLYEDSRDIARDDHDSLTNKEFSARLYEMLESYSAENQRVLVIGNTPDLWERLSIEVQMEIFYVLRELLVNLKKHSQAKFASVKFEKFEDKIHIKYTDNGVGLDMGSSGKKSGIKNMENRIELLSGKINFEPNPTGGLITEILIPNK